MHFHNIHNIISKGISDRRLIFFSFIFSGRQSKRQCLQWRNQSMKWSSSVIRALRSRTVHIMKHLLYLWVRMRNSSSLHVHSSTVFPHHLKEDSVDQINFVLMYLQMNLVYELRCCCDYFFLVALLLLIKRLRVRFTTNGKRHIQVEKFSE